MQQARGTARCNGVGQKQVYININELQKNESAALINE